MAGGFLYYPNFHFLVEAGRGLQEKLREREDKLYGSVKVNPWNNTTILAICVTFYD